MFSVLVVFQIMLGLDLLADLLNALHVLYGALHDLKVSTKPFTQLHAPVNENFVLIIHILLNFQCGVELVCCRPVENIMYNSMHWASLSLVSEC